MGKLIGGHQVDCYDNLRMDHNAFGRLCILLRNRGGLVDVSVEEQVAVFLSILAHHKKNCVVKFNHQRSGQTVSHYVHDVLLFVLKMHTVLFVKPEPVPNDTTNPRWKWFKVTITYVIMGKQIALVFSRHTGVYIRNKMSIDPPKVFFDSSEDGQDDSAEIPDVISTIKLTVEWTGWRDQLAQEMFQEYMDGV
ncbi:hypothetical protein ACS0TY_024708 [Phlomoides rotata]